MNKRFASICLVAGLAFSFTLSGCTSKQGGVQGIRTGKALSPDELYQLNKKANDAVKNGDFKKGQEFYQQALDGSSGEKDPQAAAALVGLAFCDIRVGDHLDDAQKHLEHAIKILENAGGPTNPQMVRPLSDIAYIYERKGITDKRWRVLNRGIKIGDKAPSADQLAYANCLAGAAEMMAKPQPAKAEPLFLKSLAVKQKAAGPDSEQAISAMEEIGLFYSNTNRYDKAEDYVKRALALREKQSPDSSDVARCYNDLGKIADGRKNQAQALDFYNKALTIATKKNDVDIAAHALQGMAYSYGEKKEWKPAQQELEKALALLQKQIPADGALIADSYRRLAFIAKQQNNSAGEEGYLKNAVDAAEKGSAPPPVTGAHLDDLAWYYRDNKKVDEAEKLFRKALELKAGVLKNPKGDSGVAFSANSLASLLTQEGKKDEATAIRQKYVR